MTRGARFVVVFLLTAAAASAAAVLLLYLAVGREPDVPRRSTLVLRPSGELPEIVPDVAFGAGDELTLRGYLEDIRKAKADPRVAGILLEPGRFESPFWAKIQELRAALVDFRQSGKFVHAHLDEAGDREYLLATAADRIFLLPTSTLDLTGIATYEVFLRGALDWAGTYPDFLHVGEYKTAVNTFVEKGLTPAHREMSESLNRDQYDQLVSAIAEGRRKSEAEVRAALDAGPLLPDEALRLGLVDEVAYEDELDDLDATLAESPSIEAADYARTSWESAGVRRGAVVAVINAAGIIASGRSGFDPVNGAIVGSDSMVEYIRKVRDERDVRAIVIRIDSPGGSSVASDVIWRELSISGTPGRPIVASMSDLAASGGYYVALGADAIVAQPGTLTGSIGVYTGKFVTTGTLDKIGINVEGTSSGRHAEMYSPDRRFTPEERAKVEASMQAVYDAFVERAAEARHMAPEKIDEIARGRVWTGRQARQLGLVDELGGLWDAIALAKQRARIPLDEEVELRVYPPRRSVYELLSEGLQGPAGRAADLRASEALAAVLGPRDRRALAALAAPARLFRAGQILAHMPYVFVR